MSQVNEDEKLWKCKKCGFNMKRITSRPKPKMCDSCGHKNVVLAKCGMCGGSECECGNDCKGNRKEEKSDKKKKADDCGGKGDCKKDCGGHKSKKKK